MKISKEKIMTTALELFSKYGYDAVSISSIASKLCVTKGALYRHYESKNALFESILDKVRNIDRENAESNSLPIDNESEYHISTLDDFIEFTIKQFQFYTLDEFGSAFRRVVVLEQFRNGEMIHLYQDIFLNGPIKYTQKVFDSLIKDEKLIEYDSYQLALEFYSPFFTLLSLSDHTANKLALVNELREIYKNFANKYGVKHEFNN